MRPFTRFAMIALVSPACVPAETVDVSLLDATQTVVLRVDDSKGASTLLYSDRERLPFEVPAREDWALTLYEFAMSPAELGLAIDRLPAPLASGDRVVPSLRAQTQRNGMWTPVETAKVPTFPELDWEAIALRGGCSRKHETGVWAVEREGCGFDGVRAAEPPRSTEVACPTGWSAQEPIDETILDYGFRRCAPPPRRNCPLGTWQPVASDDCIPMTCAGEGNIRTQAEFEAALQGLVPGSTLHLGPGTFSIHAFPTVHIRGSCAATRLIARSPLLLNSHHAELSDLIYSPAPNLSIYGDASLTLNQVTITATHAIAVYGAPHTALNLSRVRVESRMTLTMEGQVTIEDSVSDDLFSQFGMSATVAITRSFLEEITQGDVLHNYGALTMTDTALRGARALVTVAGSRTRLSGVAMECMSGLDLGATSLQGGLDFDRIWMLVLQPTQGIIASHMAIRMTNFVIEGALGDNVPNFVSLSVGTSEISGGAVLGSGFLASEGAHVVRDVFVRAYDLAFNFLPEDPRARLEIQRIAVESDTGAAIAFVVGEIEGTDVRAIGGREGVTFQEGARARLERLHVPSAQFAAVDITSEDNARSSAQLRDLIVEKANRSSCPRDDCAGAINAHSADLDLERFSLQTLQAAFNIDSLARVAARRGTIDYLTTLFHEDPGVTEFDPAPLLEDVQVRSGGASP